MTKRISKNYNTFIIEALAEKPIAFNPVFARIAKSAGAGLFLSQLLYWWGKGSDERWIYKTVEDVRAETMMTRSEQNRAIAVWKQLGALQVVLRGLPRRRHFQINMVILADLIELETGTRVQIPANQRAEFGKLNDRIKRPITESITENTQEKTFRDSGLQPVQRPRFDVDAARKDLAKQFSFTDKRGG